MRLVCTYPAGNIVACGNINDLFKQVTLCGAVLRTVMRFGDSQNNDFCLTSAIQNLQKILWTFSRLRPTWVLVWMSLCWCLSRKLFPSRRYCQDLRYTSSTLAHNQWLGTRCLKREAWPIMDKNLDIHSAYQSKNALDIISGLPGFFPI